MEREHARTGIRELYDNLDGIVVLHDPESGEIVHANQSFCDLLGYDRERLLSMGMGDFVADVPGHDHERMTNVVASAADQEESIEVEWPVTTADGRVRWIESRLRVIKIGAREVVLSTSVDVTEERRQERKYEQVFDNVNDVISVHDPWDEELVDVNETLCDLTGYGREALIKMDIGGFSVSEEGFTDERAYEIQQRVAATGEGETVEWMIETAAGERRLLEVKLAPATIAGEDRVLTLSRDVTERTEYERQLERERDRRSVLFENNPDPVVRVRFEDGDPIIREVNPAFEEVFGFPPDEVVGSTVAEAVVPEAEREEHDRFSDRVARGESVEAEARRQTADGIREFRFRVIHFSTDLTADEATDAYVWYTDITERRRREREYEQLFNGVNDSITVHDPETAKLLNVNETFCDLLGYGREEIIDMGIEGYTLSDADYTMEQAREFVSEVVDSDEPRQTEWVVETSEGEKRWLDVKGTTVELGGELRYVSINRDITERKRREREYEQIFDGVNDSIVVQDPETAQPLDANQTFLNRLGYDTVEEIREAGFNELSASDAGYTRERAQEICQRVMETGDPETIEWQQETRSGDRRWIEATVDAAEIRGEDRILSMQRDITERKRRERMIRALHEATDDLQEVETPEAVCAAAVDAATEVLDLWLPTCWLHEYGESAHLSPVASGEEADSISPEDRPRALSPDDFEYGVYEDGERAVCDPTELDGGTPPGDAVLFPLGDHGLFGAVERDGAFDDVTLDAAGILARHVTAALDRVERARELRERDRRFRLIAEHIDEIIYVATADFSEILYINPAYEEIYSRPVDELSEDPTSFVEAAHPDDRPEYEADVERLIEDVEAGDPQDAYEGEYRIERDGETRWVTVTRFPVRTEGETVDRIVGRVEDITERKRREREYEQIFNMAGDGLVVHDPDSGAVVDANEQVADLLGYDREAFLDRPLSEFQATAEGVSGEQAREMILESAREGGREFQWPLETADGETVWVRARHELGEIGGERRIVALLHDITERRHTERRLSEILNRIDDAIFMTRAEAITAASQDPDYVSSGYEDIWGQSLETIRETYDDGFFGTLHPDDAGEYQSFVEGIVDDIEEGTAADSYSREYRIERPDGEVRWVQSDYYPTEWASGEPRIVIVSRDITDRKSRERRMASFEDATDDLATADTPEEATRTAVEAATDTLDLPAVGAFLYDDENGVLRPEVLTGQLPADVAADPIGPGDGPLWKGFATGTIVASDGGHSESGFVGAADDAEPPGALGDLTEWRALALGNHGVLLVGSPDSQLGPETVQAAHVLAATLEAAFNHLEGEQRLAAQEEQLRTQTERADRLDRIARLTQQVEAAITEASNPGEVEQAVCDRLAGSGPYDLAWVGGLDVGSDRLAARAVVGASNQYVDALDLTTTDETADPHPAVDAWRTDEARVADSLVADGPAGDWRRQGLSEGYQSLCAVPLTYDGITHGVLTIGTDSPNAFGDRERDVIAQLGTSIANAIAAIERRRALESDETVELEFTGSGEALSFARAASAADCRVRLERTAARQDGPVSVYYSFEGDVPDDVAEIATRRLPGTVEVVAEESSSTLVEARTDDWFGAPLAEYGGVLREASAEADETTIRVEVPREADVRSFVERLEEIAPSLELVAQRQHRRRDRAPAEISDQVRAELTDRQFEVVRTALSAGYFEWPREHDGNEVAAQLDITQPTFNKHLRLAQRKTFGLLFEADA
ncbi:PAS domain S-box protein [Halosimplex halobium]|uniref:PAS domain S-box protein n=1 Tax=Halosimplex halobium TaxID=3396618 RepID=UPI003F558047